MHTYLTVLETTTFRGQEQLYQRHLSSLAHWPVTLVRKTQGSRAKASGWLETPAASTVTPEDISKVLSTFALP